MKKFIREKFNSILRSEAHKAGVIPVQSPDDENQRLAEIERLGILERDLSGERKYNSMTQVASHLTGCKIARSIFWNQRFNNANPASVST